MVISQPVTSQKQQADSLKRLDYDLVIVGGGLVGATLACGLKDSGLQVAIVEARPESLAVARGQAYHINLMSSRIFTGLGVWKQMRSGVNPIDQIRLSDADYSQTVQFDERDLGTGAVGYVAEHRVVLEGLQSGLRQCANVSYLCPAELVEVEYHDDCVELVLSQAGETRRVRSQLLVAADGARSPIRQQAGIRTQGWQYWQSCVVAFVQPEKSHRNIAYERFWSSGPFAILPLPENLCRIVWTAPKAEAAAIAQLDDAEFLVLLRQRYGDQMGALAVVGSRSVFPVQLMHSQRYTLPRLALIGDAAHCCHPVGGQGVNLGIRDAAALAEVLKAAQAQGEDIGSLSVLRRYERWRKVENLVILGFTDILNRTFSNRWLPLVVLRRLGLLGLRHIPLLRRIALRLMTGLSGRSPEIAERL
ncbi:MAG TPA: FAD-dependent hydroxylase [Thermosynechococcaceae cyanobacterium]